MVELLALGLALRLTRARKLIEVTHAVSVEIEMLGSKIELYRKRAKRAAAGKLGKAECASIGDRWRRNLDWIRYNALYTKAHEAL